MFCRPILLAASALTMVSAPVLANPKLKSPIPPRAGAATVIAKPAPQPTEPAVTPVKGCPALVEGGEAAADWRPPPIPPKEAHGGNVQAEADWRPPPIPPKQEPSIAATGGEAAADWRPPPIPPRDAGQVGLNCNPAGSESADWRPPPIPPKR
jgi:hypothetical protein